MLLSMRLSGATSPCGFGIDGGVANGVEEQLTVNMVGTTESGEDPDFIQKFHGP